MPALEDRLADMATHPPVAPTPVTEIQGRARRRVRRRRVVACSAVMLAVAAAALGVGVVVSSSDPGEDVYADGGPSTSTSSLPSTSSPSTSGAVPAEPGLTLTPASGYIEGSVVEMALTEPATGDALVAQCASEVLDEGADLAEWCVAIEEAQADDLLPYSLTRGLSVGGKLVDCATSAGRCVLAVRLGGPDGTDLRSAPLAFDPDLGALTGPEVTVDGDEGTVGDGDTLLVTLEGVATGEWIVIHQCRTAPPAHLADTTGSQCDYVRSRTIDVQDGPETQLTFTAFHDLYLNDAPEPGGVDPGWVPCAPCELQVFTAGSTGPVARLPLEMEPTDAPIRPTIALDPATDHVPGGTVAVSVAGLQPSTRATIGWCLLETAQGGGGSPCSGPLGVMAPTSYDVAVDGTIVIPDFALPRPDQEAGEECLAVPDTCGVGIDSGDGTTTVAIAPLTFPR